VERPCPAERDQAVRARIVAPLDRDLAQGALHAGVGHHEDPLGSLLDGQIQRCRQLAFDDRCHPLAGDGGATGTHRVGGESAQQQLGVGDRRLGATTPVADRPRPGTCRPWAHSERPTVVHPGDRATAGADGVDVDHRHPDRVGADAQIGRDRRLAAFDQADVTGGPAHVHRDQLLTPSQARHVLGPLHTCCRPRQKRIDGAPPRSVDVDEPAVGLHDRRPDRDALFGEPRLKSAEIVVHHGDQRRVQRRRQRAFVLADLRQDRARARDGHAEVRCSDVFGQAALVCVVLVGEQQADGDAIDAGGRELLDDGVDSGVLEWLAHGTPLVQALCDLVAPMPGDDRWSLLGL